MRNLCEWFYARSIWAQTLCVTLLATVSAEFLTLIFYSIFFSDRLLLDLALTAVITVLVAFPIGYVFLRKTATVARLAAELDAAATTDFLTGLSNRRHFIQVAQEAIDSVPPSTSAGAVLFIDVDHFKLVNDRFGHAEGDRVLVLMAESIRQSVRANDIAARIGGEEFAVFMPGADLSTARLVSERIRLNCRLAGSGRLAEGARTTVSIGLSLHSPAQLLDDVLKTADDLLYQAKQTGRDRIAHNMAA